MIITNTNNNLSFEGLDIHAGLTTHSKNRAT